MSCAGHARAICAGAALAACTGVAPDDPGGEEVVATTQGAIAIANLDHLIAERAGDPSVIDLLLARARFLGDDAALDRATALAEPRAATAEDRLRRARTRAAVHRFADALGDLGAAERAGGDRAAIALLRAALEVAIGDAPAAIAVLEAEQARRPGFASDSALAGAYAAVGRIVEADRLYVTALGALDTTSPLPYAWIAFARARMWREQGGDPARGEVLYGRALRYLPQFAAASIELAESEAARGDRAQAIARLAPVAAASRDPEALGLLGTLHIRAGDAVRGRAEIAAARARFTELLARYPLAFADHAAEFYRCAGDDPERAWQLACDNLAARTTDRAFALAIMAARATGRAAEAHTLAGRARAMGYRILVERCP